MTELTGFFREAVERGFVHDFSTGDWLRFNDLFMHGPVTGYVGFDCTANSLHVGNLASLMLLRLFRKHGHQPIVLLGTATSRVGDPSGKDEQRTMLPVKTIRENAISIANDVVKVILPDVQIHQNSDWLEAHRLGIIEFLTEVGQYFSVNRMLTQDSVKNRLNRQSSLSFLEFSYVLLQAYDFVKLNEVENCTLQMGGSDQWGNICMGVELARKMKDVELYGMTTPLIETAAGTKMGKTADGAVWLSPNKLSPYEYWQFWRNTDDKDVFRFLKMFTELELDVINDYEKLLAGKEKHPNYAELINSFKKILATEATRICHGEHTARVVSDAAESIFVLKSNDGLPVTEVTLPPYGETRYADLFVKAGLVKSVGEARRLAKGGGAYVADTEGNTMILSEYQMIEKFSALNHPMTEVKLSAGQKRHALIKFTSFHVR